MKQATRERLNALNARFYSAHAAEFSATRARAWPGTLRALDLAAEALRALPDDAPVRVLDLGCGNGRLIEPLHARFAQRLSYLGLDASEPLLSIARARSIPRAAHFTCVDLVASDPALALPAGPFELVTLLGVLHHVPGESGRRALVRSAAERLARGGVLALTLWRFDRSPRFARRRIAGDERAAVLAELGLAESDLEPGDELLRWGNGALRYCHFGDAAERERLLPAARSPLLASFRADGEGEGLNDYALFSSPHA